MLRENVRNGLFITFEGIDGCGKSTQARRAAAALEAGGVTHVLTREPGGTEIGERIRAIVMDSGHTDMSRRCELLLYCAARAQHVHELIRPVLERGEVVLCDRFADATMVYQGDARGINAEQILMVNGYATGGLEPAHTFLFDIDVGTARARIEAMNRKVDRMERETGKFHEAVRAGYLDLARRNPRRFEILDAARPVTEIARRVAESLTRLVGRPVPLAIPEENMPHAGTEEYNGERRSSRDFN